MNLMRRYLLLVLGAVLIAAFATAQSTLGNMFKLGGSTTANLPASSTYTVGALIYDLDAGAPKYNDGTSWQSFGGGGSGGDSYWLDAGTVNGFYGIFPNDGTVVRNPDGGSGLRISMAEGGFTGVNEVLSLNAGSRTVSNNGRPGIFFYGDTNDGNPFSSGALTGIIYGARNSTGGVNGGLNLVAGSVTFSSGTAGESATRHARINGSSGAFESYQSSGNNAVQFNTSGARLDLGTGTDDYFSSDGTGIVAASYVRVGNYNDAGIPSAASIPGAIAYNTSQGAPVWSDGTSWQSFGGGGSGDSYWSDAGVFSAGGSRTSIGPSVEILRTQSGNPIIFANRNASVATVPRHAVMLSALGNTDNQTPTLSFNPDSSNSNPADASNWIFASSTSSGGVGTGLNLQGTSPFFFSTGALGPSATIRMSVTATDINGFVPFTGRVGAGANSFAIVTNGSRLDLGTGSTDYLFSDGVDTVTAGGILIGNTGTRIASTPACTTTSSGGALAANTCEQIRGITCSPATTGSPCAVGVPGGTSNKSTLVTQCWVSDTDVVALNICNVGTVSITPPAQTYTVRVFNQ